MLRLKRFRVKTFRSIRDSGWVDVEAITPFIGDNEAGKTNLLVPLWKLNPMEGSRAAIDPVADYPRSRYAEFRGMDRKPVFVEAVFAVPDGLAGKIAELTGRPAGEARLAMASMDFDGRRALDFPGLDAAAAPAPALKEARRLVRSQLPKFVYYSNYGTLDSEIYLPHVVQNLGRRDMGPKEEGKSRTLRALFEFVGLDPGEILSLGREGEGADAAERKRERDVLLQAASKKLTGEFHNWWKAFEYRFRFAADGNHFRIWVSDDKRTSDIELEGRSAGFQWFFGFFIVFLVEARYSHEDAVLLLDEPGLTLCPQGQKCLSNFFDGLARTNQVIYTTHSPFMVDADKLGGVRAVHRGEGGYTVVSDNLRRPVPGAERERSLHTAHAALGLTVSDVLFRGCRPVVVEGPSDQIYLSMMKAHLAGRGLLAAEHELVFIPGSGVRTVKALAAVLSGRDGRLPCVLLDSDRQGEELARSLGAGLYAGERGKVVMVGRAAGKERAEIEDLVPEGLLLGAFARMIGEDPDAAPAGEPRAPVVPRMEAWAGERGRELPPGWKVDLAKRARSEFAAGPARFLSGDMERRWARLFRVFADDGRDSEEPPAEAPLDAFFSGRGRGAAPGPADPAAEARPPG